MKSLELRQGSPEWHAHRKNHFNASDAPAMLGCSPYKTRTQLLHELHTGITPEADEHQQRRFDSGHEFEALARPLAEEIVGEDLYPVVGTEGRLSASFDGLTMDQSIAFEHKTLNDQLRAALFSDESVDALPKAYRVQMEQQCMVSGATRVLFMASTWHEGLLKDQMHAWYEPDAELRAEILAGWEQFARDLEAYVPAQVLPAVVAAPVQTLPTVSVRLQGSLVVASNLPEMGAALRAFIDRMVPKPSTDQEFADAEAECKALKKAEDALEQAETSALGELTDVAEMQRMVADLRSLARATRLAREKIVAAEKENRRTSIVTDAAKAFRAHVEALNRRLGRSLMPEIAADFGGAIKGKKNFDSMQDAVALLLAQSKIEANATADLIQANLKHLDTEAAEYMALFPDVRALVCKQADDFRAIVQFRISDQRAKEEKRAEAQRERIREEERQRAEREAEARAAEERRKQAAATPVASATSTPAPVHAPATTTTAVAPLRATTSSAPAAAPVAADAVPTLSIGQIGTRLGFTLPAAFLETLGFTPTRARGALLFHEADWPRIKHALVEHIEALDLVAEAA